jgi:hypothetical protein
MRSLSTKLKNTKKPRPSLGFLQVLKHWCAITCDKVHFYLSGKHGKFVRSKPVSSADADK